ncbi:MAG: hypothetical protein QJR02_07405 [Sinobacteraceae bacterium]|nr:hypothetical protein [Nevskiaceae bacterium]
MSTDGAARAEEKPMESDADLFGGLSRPAVKLPEQYILLIECGDEDELTALWREMIGRNKKCRMLMS